MSDNIIIQPYRNINIKIFILDYSFNVIDELSGVAENVSFTNDSNGFNELLSILK